MDDPQTRTSATIFGPMVSKFVVALFLLFTLPLAALSVAELSNRVAASAFAWDELATTNAAIAKLTPTEIARLARSDDSITLIGDVTKRRVPGSSRSELELLNLQADAERLQGLQLDLKALVFSGAFDGKTVYYLIYDYLERRSELRARRAEQIESEEARRRSESYLFLPSMIVILGV